ncbi:MAG TPA: DEAD/DEAH box helicase [Methanoregulaceae archaeon]|nr:DEAD/DEAH box helicase [Methanoregulaceae archaeon]
MTVVEFIGDLRSDTRFLPCISHIEHIPEREAEFGCVEDLPGSISDYLEKREIKLFSHQCEAILALREGENIILATSTASGKTLAFSLPVFERFSHDSKGTALYIYPTKALTRDQFHTLAELEYETDTRINPGIYDGDTPRDKRPRIREISRIVLSNPHELHHILSWHHLWSRFFSQLRFVIIDEAHRYRGVFGSNTAFLIRRLRRICSHYGADPQFVLSSATIANPLEFAEKLCGKEFRLISGDGSPHGARDFVMYNPYNEGNKSRTIQRETTALLLESIKRDLQVLCFTNSRKSTELITLMARDMIVRERLESAGKISAYRAGYLPEERKKIEQMLKCGDLRGVVSTNALEVGIDIGTLDGVILSGYPGTMTASWQQAGRAGRSRQNSFAFLVAQPDPLDQYFMRHPQAFFHSTHEHAIIDLTNPYILAGQVLCAASELPITKEDDQKWFGDQLSDLVDAQARQKLLAETRRGFVYSGHRKAADIVSISNISQDTFRIVCRGITIETMDRSQAYREAHQGAIMLHQGEQYVVDEMDLLHHLIRIRPAEVDYYTKPLKSVDITVQDIQKSNNMEGISVFFGDVEVTEHYNGYKIMKYDTVLGVEPIDLPPIRFCTKALWFTVPPDIEGRIRSQVMDFDGGLHGIEHAFIAMMPFHVMCDRWDIGGLSVSRFGEGQEAAVFVYDGYEGGIGLAEKAYDLFSHILSMTHMLIRDCECSEGCPSCIYSPKCGNDNIPLDKGAAVAILEQILSNKEMER